MVVRLPPFWTILLDFIAWGAIQTGVAYLATRLPRHWLDPRSWLLRTRAWEQGGALYERLFRVRRWKARLPEGGKLFQGGFSLRALPRNDPGALPVFIRETCRAEICHWIAIAPAPLFFLWNLPAVGLVMIAYALAINAPCIIAQRYNRPRLLRAYERGKRNQAHD